MKLDPVLKKETFFMTIGCAICTAVMAIIFISIGKFDYTVLIGLAIGLVLSIGNYFLMGFTLTIALQNDEIVAKRKMQRSYVVRSVLMLVIMAGSIVLDFINWIPVVAAVFYPRIVILIRGIYMNIREKKEGAAAAEGTADVKREIIEGEEMAESENYEEVDEFEKFVGGFARGSAVRDIEKAGKSGVNNDEKPDDPKNKNDNSTPKDVK